MGFKGENPDAARVLISDKRIDLAVIQIVNPKKDYVPLAINSKGAENGTDIAVIGYPLAFDLGDDPKIHLDFLEDCLFRCLHATLVCFKHQRSVLGKGEGGHRLHLTQTVLMQLI